MTGRRSIRRFLPTAVSEQTIHAILQEASSAASGTNIQPWLVRVVLAAAQVDETSHEYHYLPE